jgi:hypothetical protein
MQGGSLGVGFSVGWHGGYRVPGDPLPGEVKRLLTVKKAEFASLP